MAATALWESKRGDGRCFTSLLTPHRGTGKLRPDELLQDLLGDGVEALLDLAWLGLVVGEPLPAGCPADQAIHATR